MAKQSSAAPTPSTPARKRPRHQAAVDGDEEEEGRPDWSSASSPSPAGYIFMCSGTTKPECYMRRCLGLPRGRLDAVSRIRRGAALFLYDFDAKHLYGPYRADSDGGLDLVPDAFHGRFPAQVKFTIDGDFLPVPESSLRSAIKENYSNGKFSPELALTQVEKLRTLFRPIIVLPESALLHNVDDRHPAPPAEYLPPSASHPTQPATNQHSMSHTTSSPMRERLRPPVEEDEEKGEEGHSAEFYASSPAGYIFMCNSVTKAECYRHRVLGLPRGRLASVSRIKRGTTLFLYDFDAKHLYGPYCAECDGGLALVPDAFQGRFPAQVKFRIDGDFMHIPESSLRTAIKENYSNGKFSPELTPTQVEKLRKLFRPIIVMPKSSLPHNVDDRHPAPASLYLPPASDPTQPVAYVRHPTSCIPPTALPVLPEAYAHPYAQMPPTVQFSTPAYSMSTEYPFTAAHTAYGRLSSTYQYVQAPLPDYLYGQQSLSDHVLAPGYYTNP
ncbi:hypothetical protein ABZP36_009096 [Zizania latifolia]